MLRSLFWVFNGDTYSLQVATAGSKEDALARAKDMRAAMHGG